MEKIQSKYTLKNIISYIPSNTFLKLLKTNKRFQKFVDISILTYQKSFLLQKLPINYNGINVDALLEFLNTEFNNFTNINDKNNLIKIVEDIKKENSCIITNIKDKFLLNIEQVKGKEQEDITNISRLINLSANINIVRLNLYLEKEKIIPSGLFPNLKILAINNYCIIPASMMINLSELKIVYYFDNELKILNDINKKEFNLDNLEKLEVIDSINYNDEDKNIIKDEKYNIKFFLNNLKILDINSYYNNYLFFDYFNLDFNFLSYHGNINKEVRKKPELLLSLREGFYKYDKIKSLLYLKIEIKFGNSYINYPTKFKIKINQNGEKIYSFGISKFSEDSIDGDIHLLYKEKYKINTNKEKNLKYYENYQFKLDISLENSLNIIKIKSKKMSFDNSELSKLFDLNKDNYSIQEISLNLKYQYKNIYNNIIKNTQKLKVLKKLYLYDYISKYELIILVKNISSLKLLEEIYFESNEMLSGKEENLVKKLLPKSNVEINEFGRTIISLCNDKDNLIF